MSIAEDTRRKELADFLKTRRMRISPQDLGLPPDSHRRRIPGLRREEVAVMAGISLPWYTLLEQGRDIRVSEQVLESLARTLRLDASERRHLFLLAGQGIRPVYSQAPELPVVKPALRQHLAHLEPCPAYIHDAKWNVLAWNRMATELYGDFGAMKEEERNVVWQLFTQPDLRRRFSDWEDAARTTIAQFRLMSAKNLHDPWYPSFVDRISRVSPSFETWWSRHDVQCTPDTQHVVHPSAGKLTMYANTFAIMDNGGKLYLLSMMPDPASDTKEKLERLYKGLSAAVGTT